MNEAIAQGRNNIIGFEANGGLLTASEFTINGHALWPLPTRDSFLPILSALHLAATRKRPLSEIVAEYAMSFAMSDRLQDFPVETSAALMTHLCESDDNLAALLAPIA